MSTAEAPAKSLSDPALKAALQELRRTDNVTNWWYVLRTYLYLALVLGGAVWFFENREALELPWALNVPVALLAIILVGAGQHQLSGLAHEGSHYILFRHRHPNRPRLRPVHDVPVVREHLPLPPAAPRAPPVRQRPR